jgi:hypothetical protein
MDTFRPRITVLIIAAALLSGCGCGCFATRTQYPAPTADLTPTEYSPPTADSTPGVDLTPTADLAPAGDLTPTADLARTEYIERGRPIKVARVRGIQKGETTQTQIIQWFGAPTNRAATDDDIAYTYRYCKKKTSVVDTRSARQKCAELSIVFDRVTSTVKELGYTSKLPEGRVAKLSLQERGEHP